MTHVIILLRLAPRAFLLLRTCYLARVHVVQQGQVGGHEGPVLARDHLVARRLIRHHELRRSVHLVHHARHLLLLFLLAFPVHRTQKGEVVGVLRALRLVLLRWWWVACAMIILQNEVRLHVACSKEGIVQGSAFLDV